MKRLVISIGERIVKEAEVVERELRQEEELTSILPSKRLLRPSRTPKLRPSVPRPRSIRQSQPMLLHLQDLKR